MRREQGLGRQGPGGAEQLAAQRQQEQLGQELAGDVGEVAHHRVPAEQRVEAGQERRVARHPEGVEREPAVLGALARVHLDVALSAGQAPREIVIVARVAHGKPRGVSDEPEAKHEREREERPLRSGRSHGSPPIGVVIAHAGGGAPVRRPGHATLLPPPRSRNGSTGEWRARSCPAPGACSGVSRSAGRNGSIPQSGREGPERRGWPLGPGPQTFAVLLAAYAIGHAALRVWVSPILNIDDAREAIFSQSLAWGYQPRQPPLYTWLAWVDRPSRRGERRQPHRAQVRGPRRRVRLRLPDGAAGPGRARARPARGVLAAPAPARRVVRPRRPHAERGGPRGGRRDGVRC